MKNASELDTRAALSRDGEPDAPCGNRPAEPLPLGGNGATPGKDAKSAGGGMPGPITHDLAERHFGPLGTIPDTADPGRLPIPEQWAAENLVRTAPLAGIAGTAICGMPGTFSGRALVHRRIKPFLEEAFARIAARSLSGRILCWGGSYVPRRQRGSNALSRHAYGIAFDINVAWNPYKKTPAPAGTPGSVLELVPLFEECGFYWGGRFSKNPDGMHFEFNRIDWL